MSEGAQGAAVLGHAPDVSGVGITIAKVDHNAITTQLEPEIPVNLSSLSSAQSAMTLSVHSELGEGSNLELLNPNLQRSQSAPIRAPSAPQTGENSNKKGDTSRTVELPQTSGSMSSVRVNVEDSRKPGTPLLSPTGPRSKASSEFERALDAVAKNGAAAVLSQGSGKRNSKASTSQGKHQRSPSQDEGNTSSKPRSRSPVKPSRAAKKSTEVSNKPLKNSLKNAHSQDVNEAIAHPQNRRDPGRNRASSAGPTEASSAQPPNARLQPERDFIQQVQGILKSQEGASHTEPLEQDLSYTTWFSDSTHVADSLGGNEAHLAAQRVFQMKQSQGASPQFGSHQNSFRETHPGQSSLPTVPEEGPLDDTAALSRCVTA
jgi:hypothetical protein